MTNGARVYHDGVQWVVDTPHALNRVMLGVAVDHARREITDRLGKVTPQKRAYMVDQLATLSAATIRQNLVAPDGHTEATLFATGS